MEIALHDITLALFTTFAPIGCGVYIALFIAYLRDAFNEQYLRKIDRMMFVPPLFMGVGLVCAFAHLASPQNALNVIFGIGSSGLANEMLAFCIVFALTLVYWVVAATGGLRKPRIRKCFTGAMVAAGFVFTLFVGIAYLIPTVPTWDSSKSILQPLCAWLFGGTAVGMLLCALAGEKGNITPPDELVNKTTVIFAGVLLIISLIFSVREGFFFVSATIDVAASMSSLMGVFIGAIVCIIASAVCIFASRPGIRVPLSSCGAALAVVGVFLARMVFYGIQFGIGV